MTAELLLAFRPDTYLSYYSAPSTRSRVLHSMQMLVDFFPLLLFLGAFLYSGDLFVGLQVLMVAMPVAFLVKWWLTKKIDKILLWSTVALLVMGTISLVTKNPDFLFWKPTVFYWILSVVFLGSQFIGEQPLSKRFFSAVGEMPLPQWRKLNVAWVIFFALAGILNIYVAFNFSQKTWAYFKVFGFTGLTFLFIIAQVFWLMRHMKELAPEQSESD